VDAPLQVLAKLRDEFSFVQGNFLILVLSWIFMDFGMEIPEPYYSYYVIGLGGNALIIGVIGFASSMALALVQFPGGYLADKYGRRWLVSSMTFGVGLAYLFYALAPSWHLILVGAVVLNVCLIYQPALMAMVADSLPSERRGMGFSIINLIMYVSTTPGPVVAGILFLNFGLVMGMRIGYFISVALFMVAGYMRLRLSETVMNPAKIARRELLRSYPNSLKECVGIWGKVPRSMYFLFFVQVVWMFSLAMIRPYISVYAKYVLGLNEVQWAIVLTVLFAVLIALALPIGKMVDKYGRKVPLLLSNVMLVLSMVLLVYGDYARLFLVMIFEGVGMLLMMTSYSSLRADLVPQELRGKIIGFCNFVSYVFMAMAVFVGGFLYDSVSPQLPFLLAIIFTLPEFAVIAFLVHEPEKRED